MKSWSNISAVFKRELGSYFNSPIAYVILIIFLLATQGFTFLVGRFLEGGNASLTNSFFQFHPWIYLFLAPAVGMRLWSEEHRLGTWELLSTMPIAPWHAIFGKFLAVATIWAVALGLTFPIIWTVNWLGSPDPGPIWMGYLGSYLMGISFLAITMAVSAFTNSQVVCFIISISICLALTLAGFPPLVADMVKAAPDWLAGPVAAISYASVWTHLMEMAKGVLKLPDLFYFASIIFLSCAVTSFALNLRRS